jgi:hypothetical protein
MCLHTNNLERGQYNRVIIVNKTGCLWFISLSAEKHKLYPPIASELLLEGERESGVCPSVLCLQRSCIAAPTFCCLSTLWSRTSQTYRSKNFFTYTSTIRLLVNKPSCLQVKSHFSILDISPPELIWWVRTCTKSVHFKLGHLLPNDSRLCAGEREMMGYR